MTGDVAEKGLGLYLPEPGFLPVVEGEEGLSVHTRPLHVVHSVHLVMVVRVGVVRVVRVVRVIVVMVMVCMVRSPMMLWSQ